MIALECGPRMSQAKRGSAAHVVETAARCALCEPHVPGSRAKGAEAVDTQLTRDGGQFELRKTLSIGMALCMCPLPAAGEENDHRYDERCGTEAWHGRSTATGTEPLPDPIRADAAAVRPGELLRPRGYF